MSLLYTEILSAKGIVLVSPTHNYNVTSWMKAFIDRLYCFYTFEDDRPRSWSSQLTNQGRKAVIGAIYEQEAKEDMGFTIEAMSNPMQALGYEIIDALAVFKIFDKAKIKYDQQTLDNAYKTGVELVRSITS